MTGKIVRVSKYRHVYGAAAKKEYCYDNLKVARTAVDGSLAKVNPSFLSVCWDSGGGGAFAVIPLNRTGKLPSDLPLFTGHSAAVLETDFNPFNDHVIASCGEDGKIMVWNIPKDGITQHVTAPAGKLTGHERKVHNIVFHPTAQAVLASASADLTLRIWDVERGQSRGSALIHPDTINSMCWNYDGSLMITTCKDKKIRIWDMKSGQVVNEYIGHQGVKGSLVTIADREGRFVTTGFSKMSDRQISLWDVKHGTEAIKTENLDTSSGSLIPYCDVDTSLLFLAGKGDGNIRYYEVVNDNPFLYSISDYKSSDPQRGIAVMPKRGLNVQDNEIARLYKVSPTLIEPISFIVPRKSDLFQSDLYPDTLSPQPALSADEFFAGKAANPILMSLEGGFKKSTNVTEFIMSKSHEQDIDSLPTENDDNDMVSRLKKENENLRLQVASLKAEIEVLKSGKN